MLTTSLVVLDYSHYVSLVPYLFQFRALSDQFYRTPEHHIFVRDQVINQVGHLAQ